MNSLNQTALKIKVLDLINEKPRTCAIITRDWTLTPEGLNKFSLLCEGLDFHLSKMIMDWVSPDVWSQIEKTISGKRQTNSTLQEFVQLLALQGMTWEENNDKEIDPFNTIRNLEGHQVRTLVSQFEISEWGLVHAFWNYAECMTFFQHLDPSARRMVAVSIEKLKKIPVNSLKETAISFARRIQMKLNDLEFDSNRQNQGEILIEADIVAQTITAKKTAVYESQQAKRPLIEIYYREKEMEQRFTQYIGEMDHALETKVKQIIELTQDEE